MERVVESVSRTIDHVTGRRFWATTDDEVRYYTAEDEYMLFTGDIMSITSLKTDEDGDRTYENTWTTDDYDLYPENAALDGQPYTWIEVNPDLGDYEFPAGVRRGVQITGIFGFCTDEAHPVIIKEACLIQAARIFKRRDSPFGILGSPELGQLRLQNKLDPDVELMLRPMTRLV